MVQTVWCQLPSSFTMATGLSCSVLHCQYTTTNQVPDETDLASKIQLLQIHASSVHEGGGGQDRAQGVKAKMDAPKLQLGADQQTWDQFITRWEIFKTTMGVDDASSSMWLFNCLEKDLGDEVIKANPGTKPQSMTEVDLTACIKRLAVKMESKRLHRMKMNRLTQDPGVNVYNYLAALRGQSRQCQYEVKCGSCNAQADYSEEIILDLLINGLYDQDIVAALLGDEKTDRTLLETVEFIARKEQATLECTQGVSVSAANQTTPTSNRKRCRYCQGESHGADTGQIRREKCPAWDHKCTKCKVKGHYEMVCFKCTDCGKWGHKSKISKWCDANGDKQATDDEVGFMLSAMTIQPRRRGRKRRSAPKKELRRVELASKQRQGSNAQSHRRCNVTQDGQEPVQEMVIGSINAWQRRTGRMDIPVPERELRRVHTADREPSHVLSAGKLRQDSHARYIHAPTKLSASKGCQTPNAYTDGNDQSTLLPNNRGFNAELHKRRNVVPDTFNQEEYSRGRETQMKDAQAVAKVNKFSPLTYNGAILPPGYGPLGTRVSYQPTHVPVTSAATTSTATVTTSPVSLTSQKWDHYKFRVPVPQVGQLDPSSISSTVTQPNMLGTPFTLSQYVWPTLPTPLGKIAPTAQTDTVADAPTVQEAVSGAVLDNQDGIHESDQVTGTVPTIPMRLDSSVLAPPEGDANAEVLEEKGDASDVFVARPDGRSVPEADTVPVVLEEEVDTTVVNVDSDASNVTTPADTVNDDEVSAVSDNTASTIAELECQYDNCKYVTRVGQDCVQYGLDLYAAKMEMEYELRVHINGEHTEYVDAARMTASKGRTKSSGRSHGSKKRDKSRRWALKYDEGEEIC